MNAEQALTSDTPPESVVYASNGIRDVDADEYQTVFLSLAPNPVMRGHLAHIPVSRVEDVDMTVEQAVQYILTTGIVNVNDTMTDSAQNDTIE